MLTILNILDRIKKVGKYSIQYHQNLIKNYNILLHVHSHTVEACQAVYIIKNQSR